MRTSLFVAVALVGLSTASGCKKQEKQAPVAHEVAPIKLAAEDVVVIKRDMLQTGPRISGTLEARQRAVVRAEAAGAVVSIGPELGQLVKKGDLLARIEAKALGDVTTSAKSGVGAAEAARDLARREVERTEALVKGGAIAQRELDRVQSQLKQAEAGVVSARAQLSSSQSQLGDATVRSPLAGVVARRSVNAGDVVAPGAELYDIIDPSTMRLDASIASDDLASITPGKAVDFEVRGYPGQMFAGMISRVAPAADPVTRQIQVLVDIPNPGGKLVAGLYAEGRVSVEKREGLVAPLAAIDLSGDQPSVLRITNGVVERAVVALGVRDERAEVVEVTNGLAPNDTLLLVRAQKNLTPGVKVVLQAATAPAGAPKPVEAAGSAASPATGSAANPTTKPIEGTHAGSAAAATGAPAPTKPGANAGSASATAGAK